MQGAGQISGPGGSFFTSWKEPVDYFFIEPFIPGSAFFRSGNVPRRFRERSGPQFFCFREAVFLLPGRSRSIISLLNPSFREVRFFVPGTFREAVFFVPGMFWERSGCILRVGRGPRQVSGRRRTDGGERETGGCFFCAGKM
jgi:hypothetical protein